MSSAVTPDRAIDDRGQGDLLLQEPPILWQHVPRGAWLAASIGAGIIAVSMWAGVAVDAAERVRFAADPASTAAAPSLLALLTVFIPSVAILVAGGAIGGAMAIQAAVLRPTERAASRFKAAFAPTLAFVVGTVLGAVAVAIVLSTITVVAAGLTPDWDLLPRAGLVVAVIGAATGFTGLTLATVVAGAMLRPSWE